MWKSKVLSRKRFLLGREPTQLFAQSTVCLFEFVYANAQPTRIRRKLIRCCDLVEDVAMRRVEWMVRTHSVAADIPSIDSVASQLDRRNIVRGLLRDHA
jgi:hypothetical protein